METHDPRNDSGVRSLDEAVKPHKTPALISISESLQARSSARFDQVNV